MIAIVKSCTLYGINGYIVDVEVDLSSGLPAFDLVGLPDSAIRESKERVRTAINNAGFEFPQKRITVNLAPAHMKKEGPAFDLPIATAILICSEHIRNVNIDKILIAGELSLDGQLKPIRGVLPMVYSAQEKGIKLCILPFENAKEAALVEGMRVLGVKDLNELVGLMNGKIKIDDTKIDLNLLLKQERAYELDFADIKGQGLLRRAFEIAASGMHNILVSGAPGSGKTMIARRFPSILPDMTFNESIEVTKIYSVANSLKEESLVKTRPFRSPHHTISYAALTGGGRVPSPGEISLAHNGVLFLDELPEFAKKVLENLRQPLEDKVVTISRVGGTVTYPSDFILVAAMNPCPCGFFGSNKKCRCSQNEIAKYLSKISGPLLDRIDIQVESRPVKYEELEKTKKGETSAEIKKRVERVRKVQEKRFENTNMKFNSQLQAGNVNKYCVLGENEKSILKSGFERLELSARGYHRVLKLARTIADMENSFDIQSNHLMEAIAYRSLDRSFYQY